MDAEMLDHYRSLVSALLTHTWVDDDGTVLAIRDFVDSGYQGADLLRGLIGAQAEHEESIR